MRVPLRSPSTWVARLGAWPALATLLIALTAGLAQAQTAVYYSVGTNAADLKIAANVTIAAGTATFTVAQSEQPLMLTFNCLNGYFVAPNYDSLASAFMKAEGRGTIGAFSPSGLSLDGPAHRFHKALMAEIVSGQHERLGDAVLDAQAAYAETGVMPELLAIYHLLADPGMRIQ